MEICKIFTDLRWISINYGRYLTVEEVAKYTRNSIEKIEKDTSLGKLSFFNDKYNAFDVVYWNYGIDKNIGNSLILISYKHTGINNMKGKKNTEPHYGNITERKNGLLMCSFSCPNKKRENLYARTEKELIAKAEARVLEEKQRILFERLKSETDGNIEELSTRINDLIKAENTVLKTEESEGEIVDFGTVMTLKKTALPTFSVVFETWIKMKRRGKTKPQTIDRYIATYKRHISGDKSFINKPVNEITEKDVFDILFNIRKSGVTRKEYNNPNAVIKDTLTYANFMDDNDVRVNIDFQKVKFMLDNYCNIDFKSKEKTEIAIDPETERKLINEIDSQAKASCIKKAQYYLLKLNFFLGLRIGELVALTVDDIDLKAGKIYINKAEIHYKEVDKEEDYTGNRVYEIAEPKTLSGRRTILLIQESSEIIEELLAYRKRRGYRRKELFYDGDINDLKNRTGKLHNKYKKICNKMGISIKEFHCHLQRKTLATDFFTNAEDERLIIETMGHVDISTTQKFYNIKTTSDDTRKREMLQRVRDKRNATYA